jgi:hypothetical protein
MNEFAALVDELRAQMDRDELRKAHAPASGLPGTARVFPQDYRRVPLPDIKPVMRELEAMVKALPPPEPTPRDMLAAAQRTLKNLVDAGRLSAYQTARFEARIHALALRVG